MVKKKTPSFSWKKIIASAIALATVSSGAFTVKNLPYFVGEKVVEVVDGDTFIIANRQPMRLFGLNAPELSFCLGIESKQALSSLIAGKKVIIREPLSDGRGRVMALVYLDGVLVNEVMIRTGLAQYKRQGESETARLKSASDYARDNNIGIYSSLCRQTEPPDSRCAIKGNFDEQKGKKFYFLPDCRSYSLVVIQKHQGDDWFCTEKEAKAAGFAKSPDCGK